MELETIIIEEINDKTSVINTSILTKNRNKVTFDIPYSIFVEKYKLWKSTNTEMRLIQNVFPELNTDEREFLINGIIPREWEKYFGEEEE